MAYTYKHGDRPLEGYTVQRAVGRGGFGEVYYSLTDSGKQVAIKYLRENADVELRGISMVMNLKSPHLITIYDVKQDENREPFVIMEYVSGPSLRDVLLAEPNGLGVQKTAFFLSGIAKGLSYLHDRGIVHRDLKPGNIFYDDGYVKIGDYGLSKHISVSKHSGQTVSVGTVHYMAPEIGSGSYSKAIDIYAMGVILYEMLTGRLPFSGSSMGEILMRHLSERPDLSGIPEPFGAVIARALAKDPKDRYQDVNEMVDAIMESVDVSQGMSTFDPNSLASFTRPEGAEDPDRTMTRTPHRLPPIPSLDLRNASLPESLGNRLHERVDDLGRKFRDKAAKWEQRITGRFPERAKPRVPGEPMFGRLPNGRSRFAHTMVLIAVAVAISIFMGTLMGRSGREPETSISIMLYLVGGTIGSMVAYFGLLQRSLTRNTVVDRIAIAGVGALFMIPAFAVADEAGGSVERLMLPAIAVMAICDWGSRIEGGRRGKVQGNDAVWPGILGMILVNIPDGPRGGSVWMAAGLCASLSLLTQAAAAMWPPPLDDRLKQGRGVTPPTPNAGLRPWAKVRFGITRGVGSSAENRAVSAKVENSGIAAPSARDMAFGGRSFKSVTSPEPASPAIRAIFGVLSTLAMITALGCFFALVATRPFDDDLRGGLMFGTLAGLSWLTFFGRKALQVNEMPLWRGSVRWLLVSVGLTLTSGMIALLATQRLTGDEKAGAVFGLVAGGVIALVCSAVRGTGPQPAGIGGQPGAYESGPGRGSRGVESSDQRGADAAEGTAGFGVSADPAAPLGERSVATETERRFDASSAAAQLQPTVIDAAAPSFVGRTANAGLSAFGKLLLLSGLTVAVVYNMGPFTFHATSSEIVFDGGKVQLTSEKHKFDGAYTIPRSAILLPIGAGAFMLLMARRNDGGLHFMRGMAGGILGVMAVLFAVGPAASEIPLFLRGDWDSIGEAGPLVAAGACLVCSLAMVFWPKRRGQMIVI